MKRILTLLIFALAAAAPLAAEDIDMVTILPDDVASFIRLDVKQNAVMSKVTLGNTSATSVMTVSSSTALNVNQIMADGTLSTNNLTAYVNPLLNFYPNTVGVLIIEGDLNSASGTAATVNRLFINGAEMQPTVPSGLAWCSNVSVEGITGANTLHVLCAK